MDEQYYEYRTGQTKPQKSSRGLIAFLLICVIFLCGVVSLLGMLNIHLFRQLQQLGTETPLSFAEGELDPTALEEQSLTVGGITVQELPEVYQQLHELPPGLFVVDSQVEQILPGDVLTEFDGAAVTTLEELNTLYAGKTAGDRLWFTFHRQGEAFSYSTFFGN